MNSKAMKKIITAQICAKYGVAQLQEVRFPTFTADVLFISDKKRRLIGVEIKADNDSSRRLRGQLQGYLQWFNVVFVFCTKKQLKGVEKVLKDPEFKGVGIMLLQNNDDIEIIRHARIVNDIKTFNPRVNTGWISKKHQLQRWLWLLQELWG